MAQIAQKAVDFIVAQEVTSPAYYAKHYQNPEWPGEQSGITVACGYDLGYASPDKIRADWSHHVSPEMLEVMVSCSGVRGVAAKALLPKVKSKILIPWAAAEEVFLSRDVPQWTAAVEKVLPNCSDLSPLCLGMHVATAYNRGVGGYTNHGSSRYTELVAIRDDMGTKSFYDIGDRFLSMRRLWPNSKGLRDRYTQTAALWNEGLKNPDEYPTATPPGSPRPDPEAPLKEGPARTKPPATTPAQNTTAGGIVAASVKGASEAANSGMSTTHVAMLLLSGVAFAAVLWLLWYRNRNPK